MNKAVKITLWILLIASLAFLILSIGVRIGISYANANSQTINYQASDICSLYNKCADATNTCTDLLGRQNNFNFTKLKQLNCNNISP